MRGLDETPKTKAKTSSANDNYKEGIKNTNTVFLGVSGLCPKGKLQEV